MSVLFALIEKLIVVVVVIVVVEEVFYQIQLSLKANGLKNHWKREGGNFFKSNVGTTHSFAFSTLWFSTDPILPVLSCGDIFVSSTI